MLRKPLILISFSLIELFVGELIGNSKMFGVEVKDSSCNLVGQILKIQNGNVVKKQPGGKWQKISNNTNLCAGDILNAKGNSGDIVNVEINCYSTRPPINIFAVNIFGVQAQNIKLVSETAVGVNQICSSQTTRKPLQEYGIYPKLIPREEPKFVLPRPYRAFPIP